MGYPNSARALSESAVRARAGPGRFGALSAVREEQPEVKPYCACESCACCGSVAVRRGGERAWPAGPWAAGAGQCEGRAEPLLAGGERDAPMRAASAWALPGRPCGRALPGRCAANRAGPGRAGSGPGPIFTMRSRGVGGWDKTN